MQKYRFKVAFPPQVVYEVEAESLKQARVVATQLWFKNGWYRVEPPCPLQHTTDEVPDIHNEKELIRSLDGIVQVSQHMDMKARFASTRLKTLHRLQERLQQYQELLVEMQTGLKRRRVELDAEVVLIESQQPR